MRIAVVNWSRRRVGGTETYLGNVMPELRRLGHELFFWHETDEPRDREAIELPEGARGLCVRQTGERAAVEALREWRPDLIYTHSPLAPRLEAETLELAPAAFFAHNYYGTCISGAKTFKRPEVVPCDRRFGRECLARYFPRRCGGLSPLTMLRLYRQQSKRLELLRRYDAVLTHSAHMHAEYLKHGLEPRRLYRLAYYARGANGHAPRAGGRPGDGGGKSPPHLLFAGRMDMLKGGRTLIEALPLVREGLGRPLRLTFAGDGPARRSWEGAAAEASGRDEGLRISFAGWLPRERLEELYDECDLLVFPSLWPEPFGLAGPEAGLRGLPVAAFDVGGVSDWLVEGVNGHLAPGRPPTAEGLAEAVVKCLRDPEAYARLRRGAAETARRFSLRNHLTALGGIFEQVASGELRASA
jgi:glycosyltransferase involved in cell wall biosynthesis